MDNSRLSRIIVLVIFIIFGAAIYKISAAVYIVQTTGTLKITSSDPHANIVIGESDSKAEAIGVGNVTVRILPGSYTIIVTNNGFRAVARADVEQGTVTEKNIKTVSSSVTSDAQNIFDNLPYQNTSSGFLIEATPSATSNGYSKAILITANSASGRQAAIDWIRGGGYDPSDYKITFKDAPVVNKHYTNGAP